MKEWRPPTENHLPDFRPLEGLLECGDYMAKAVAVQLIAGSAVGAERWNPDWSLREDTLRSDSDLLAYHKEKLAHLLWGWPERGWPPMTEWRLLQGEDYLSLHLYEVQGVYFVASGGVHRVAVAHQKGFSLLKAVVTPCRFKPDAPQEARRWVASLKAGHAKAPASSSRSQSSSL